MQGKIRQKWRTGTIFKGFSALKWNFLQFYMLIFVRFLCFYLTRPPYIWTQQLCTRLIFMKRNLLTPTVKTIEKN